MKYDLAVYIGRFQPFHNGHLSCVMQGLEVAKRVLIIVGSANGPRTARNPFSLGERLKIINEVIHSESGELNRFKDRISVTSVSDHPQDFIWNSYIRKRVKEFIDPLDDDVNICVLGADKDDSTYYLNTFGWPHVKPEVEPEFDATSLRRAAFLDGKILTEKMPRASAKAFADFKYTAEMAEELRYLDAEKAAWAGSPYPPIFVTADTVVIQSGKVLLVTRRQSPGKGLLALPGGFLKSRETILDCAIRELVEETRIKIQPALLRQYVQAVEVFDRPDRSARGRVITHAHLIHLNDAMPLPKVAGADDAAKAAWYDYNDLVNSGHLFHEDHWHIMTKMISRLRT